MPSSKTFFATPQEAETAFYDALERADLEAMMAVWAEDEEVVCIHPGGPRLTGLAAVRNAWDQVFRGVKHLTVERTALVRNQVMMLAVHSVVQHITLHGEDRTFPLVVATNVWRRGADGWRLMLHHASPMPNPPAENQSVEQRVLH